MSSKQQVGFRVPVIVVDSYESTNQKNKAKATAQVKYFKTQIHKQNDLKHIDHRSNNHLKQSSNVLSYSGICKIVQEKDNIICEQQSKIELLTQQIFQLNIIVQKFKQSNNQQRNQEISRLKDYQKQNRINLKELAQVKEGLKQAQNKADQVSIEKQSLLLKYQNALKQLQISTNNIQKNKVTISSLENQLNILNEKQKIYCQIDTKYKISKQKQSEFQKSIKEQSFKYNKLKRQFDDLLIKYNQSLKFNEGIKNLLQQEKKVCFDYTNKLQQQNKKNKKQLQQNSLLANNITSQIKNLKLQNYNANEQIYKYKLENVDLKQKIQNLNKNLIQKKSGFQSSTSKYLGQIEQYKYKKKQLQDQIIKIKQQHTNLISQMETNFVQKTNQLVQQNSRLLQLLKSLKQQNQNIKQIHNCCVNKLQTSTQQIIQLKQANNNYLKLIKQKQQQNQIRQNKLIQLNTNISSLKSQICLKNQQIKALELKVQQKNNQTQDSDKKYESIITKVQTLQSLLIQKQKNQIVTINELQSIISIKQNRIKELEKIMIQVNHDLNILKKQISQYRTYIQNLQEHKHNLVNKNNLSDEYIKYQFYLKNFQQKTQSYNKDVLLKSNQIRQLQKELQIMKKQRFQLQEKNKEQKDNYFKVCHQLSNIQQKYQLLKVSKQVQSKQLQCQDKKFIQDQKNKSIQQLKKQKQQNKILNIALDKMETKYKQSINSLNSLKKDILKQKQEKKILKLKIHNLQTMNIQLSNSLSTIEKKNNQQSQKAQQLKKNFLNLQNNFKDKQKISLHQKQIEQQRLLNNSSKKQAYFFQQKQQSSKKQSKNKEFQMNLVLQERDSLKQKCKKLDSIIIQGNNRLTHIQKQLEIQYKEKESLQKLNRNLEDKLTKACRQTSFIEQQLNKIAARYNEHQMTQKVKKLQNNQSKLIKQLQDSKLTIQNLLNQNYILNKIMNQQLQKRSQIIEDLVKEKKNLYDQIRK